MAVHDNACARAAIPDARGLLARTLHYALHAMAALENLPPDQRAVLQLVLQRGRSYDEIAQLLSIERGAVRQRALDAFDALTPSTVLPGPEHALVTDYLLGQLPQKVAEQVYSFLEASEPDRVWAQAIVEVITPLVSRSLPEIPVGAPLGADDWAAGGPEQYSDPDSASAGVAADETAHAGVEAAGATGLLTVTGPEPERRHAAAVPAQREARPSSRRGGAILLGVVALLLGAAVVIAVANSGGGAGKHHASRNTARTGGQPSSTGSTTSTVTSATGSTTTPQILAQLNLTSPTGARQTVGIVEVVRDQGTVGVVIDAQGVPPNTAHNAYAFWLYNSPTSHEFVGFVPNLVGKSGKLVTEGRLPADAANYRRVLITLETQRKPTSPGEVVLSGPFREHP